MDINILAIESSCDETAAAVMRGGKLQNNVVASQPVHHQFGGVVPELASRCHQRNILPVVHEALQRADMKPEDLRAIAFTQGPGLAGALLVGASFAKGMAIALQIPLIGVNHMEAHVMAHFIDEPHPPFPFLCLTASGGHTELVWVTDYLQMEKIGETLDDAVGEAFDKGAKMLGLPYPGGPLIDRHAAEGNPDAYRFSLSAMPDFNFSFSGIKTSLLYFLQREQLKQPDFIEKNLNDICASYQKHLIQMLVNNFVKANEKMGGKSIAIAGGVAANRGLRAELQRVAAQKQWTLYLPDFAYCSDNAAMIAVTAHYKYLRGQQDDFSIAPMPRLSIARQPVL